MPPGAALFVFGDDTGPLGYHRYVDERLPDVSMYNLQGLVFDAAIDRHATRRLCQWFCRKYKVRSGPYVRLGGLSPSVLGSLGGFTARNAKLGMILNTSR